MGLREYLYEQVATHQLGVAQAKELLGELAGGSQQRDIAVVGMACHLPAADDPEQYWANLVAGRIAIGDLPRGRRANAEAFIRAFHGADLIRENRINPDGSLRLDFVRRGYVTQVEQFDAEFFGINPREAQTMDPNQRVLLETAYHALQDGGLAAGELAGRKVGVFIGIDHVEEHKYKKLAADDPMVVTGTWPGILASRLSYLWDLRGPCMVIDTACSSGLVSVHQACQSLRSGESEIAIVGGLSSFTYEAMTFDSELRQLESIESTDDTIRPFDRHAGGTTWGEGVGAVILKPLADAIRDGDRVHAVIKGSAVNNDGASNGITAPNAEAQEDLLLDAWRDARVEPETISYIEAHGTGTVLGDPIEVSALTRAFRRHTAFRQFCGIGSVKSSIGHLVGASGIASLFKVIMMLRHRQFVACVNYSEPNQFINFVDSPVFVTDKGGPWPAKDDAPRRAGVSSFGFSGTNCHVVLEEAPPVVPASGTDAGPHIFTVSAKSRGQLVELIHVTIAALQDSEHDLATVCRSANTGRDHHPWRVAVVAEQLPQLLEILRRVATGPESAHVPGALQGHFRRIGANKPNPQPDELTEPATRRLSDQAKQAAAEFASQRSFSAARTLGDLYARGADIDWRQVHAGEQGTRVGLPVYPFARTPHWYHRAPEELKPIAGRERLGAVLDSRGVSTPAGDHFVARLSPAADWILSDHIILGQHIIPGTTYLELALEIAAQYRPGPVTVRDLSYAQPCVVDAAESREIVAIVQPEGDDLAIRFMSRAAGQWQVHAECSLRFGVTGPRPTLDLEGLRHELEVDQGDPCFDLMPRPTVIQLGARWRNERIVAAGADSVLVELALPAEMAADLDGAVWHVALFDNAVNAISQKSGDTLYLPYHYREVKCWGAMPTRLFSHIRMDRDAWQANQETITYDVDLCDENGLVFASVRGYTTKRVDQESARQIGGGAQRTALGFGWQQEPAPVRPRSGAAQVLLIGGDTELAEALVTAGAQVEHRPTMRPDVLESAPDELSHVVYAVGWQPGPATAAEAPGQLIEGLFVLAKALDEELPDQELALVVVGSGAARVLPDDRVAPESNALAALTNSIGLEFSDLTASYVDADHTVSRSALARAVLAADGGPDRFLRGECGWLRQLESVELPEPAPIATEGGCYLITGGTGALGLEVAGRLAEQAPVTIGLLARSDWDTDSADQARRADIAARLEQIRRNGSTVVEFRADVTDLAAMAGVVRELRRQTADARITGVFHCAGQAGEGIIVNKSLERFRSVVSAKVDGAIILDMVTRDDPPEFLALYSSVLAIFGDIGQSDYMAGNAYLDAFAEWRESCGRRTRVINWPAWLEVGMAVRHGVAGGDNTIASMSTAAALDALGSTLAGKRVQVLPGQANPARIVGHRGLRSALAIGLHQVSEPKVPPLAQPPELPFVDSEEYTPTERELLRVWAETLQVKRIDIYDDFADLGGQSFLAIQLYKAINRAFEQQIEVSDIYSFPSVQQLAAEMDRRARVLTSAAVVKEEVDLGSLIQRIKQGKTSVADAVDLLRAN